MCLVFVGHNVDVVLTDLNAPVNVIHAEGDLDARKNKDELSGWPSNDGPLPSCPPTCVPREEVYGGLQKASFSLDFSCSLPSSDISRRLLPVLAEGPPHTHGACSRRSSGKNACHIRSPFAD